MSDLRVLSPRIPPHARAGLAAERRIDRAGAWLCGHHCTRVAELMWRTCRMI